MMYSNLLLAALVPSLASAQTLFNVPNIVATDVAAVDAEISYSAVGTNVAASQTTYQRVIDIHSPVPTALTATIVAGANNFAYATAAVGTKLGHYQSCQWGTASPGATATCVGRAELLNGTGTRVLLATTFTGAVQPVYTIGVADIIKQSAASSGRSVATSSTGSISTVPTRSPTSGAMRTGWMGGLSACLVGAVVGIAVFAI